MRFVARVLRGDGSPLPKGEVTMVAPGGEPVGRGTVENGVLTVEAEPPAVWGVLIDGRPVITFPAAVDRDRVDLGEIALVDAGVRAAAFHSIEGLCFGVPTFMQAAPTVPPRPAAGDTLAPELGIKTGLTFSGLVGSTAQQLGEASLVPSGLNLTGATITLKGVPTVMNEAVAFDFPTAELAATGLGLSQLSFTLKPQAEDRPPAPEPTGPAMPDVIGYTRELVTRKLAVLGRAAEFTTEIVRDPADQGRVVRSIPRAGTPLEPGAIIRIFIGKHEGS